MRACGRIRLDADAGSGVYVDEAGVVVLDLSLAFSGSEARKHPMGEAEIELLAALVDCWNEHHGEAVSR